MFCTPLLKLYCRIKSNGKSLIFLDVNNLSNFVKLSEKYIYHQCYLIQEKKTYKENIKNKS